MANKYKMAAQIGLHLSKKKFKDNKHEAEACLEVALGNVNIAILEDDSDHTLYDIKGKILYLMQNYDQAIECFDKYLESKKDPEIMIQKAIIYQAQANLGSAWRLLKEIIYNYPNFVDAYIEYAELANVVSDYDDALFICDKFKESNRILDPRITFQEAQALFKKDQTIDSFQSISEINSQYPDFLKNSFYLYDDFKDFCMEFLGDHNAA